MTSIEIIRDAIKYVELNNCDWAEFGVSSGKSARMIYELLPEDATLHLFDSFEGLPENWLDEDGIVFASKGEYKSEPPSWIFNKTNIVVHEGLFKDTIPSFVKNQKKCLSFINIDCDLYSSTKTIFDNIDELIVKGTIIHFDEFFNYRCWKLHEYKAFHEYVDEYNRKYRLLWRADNDYECQAYVQVIS